MISVVICTYDRCESLKDTLDSLLNQEYDGSFDYEVIIVDNNSKDKTKEVVESYMPKFNGELRYLFESRQGKSCALNLGIKESRGEIIAFTDDDVIADQKWLLEIRQCFQRYNCDSVGGRVLPLYPENTPEWVKDNKDLLNGPIVRHDCGENIQIYNKDYMPPFVGANMAFKKSCFIECGLFREDLGPGRGTFGEDTELYRRLENEGRNIYYCGKALVWHKVDRVRMSFRYIAKWSLQGGKYLAKENNATKNTICYFGIPRYILRKLITHALCLSTYLFNRDKFLQHWKGVFVSIGQCLEYKRSKTCQK